MKKLLLTLIVSFSFCGSVFSQYGTHWPDFAYIWQNNTGITAAFAINGHVYTVDDEGWDALEVGFFVGDEQRGVSFLDRDNVDAYGDPYPITPGAGIGYNDPGEAVTFKLYDHAHGVLYETCEVTYMGEPLSIITGVEDFNEYMYAWMVEPYDPIILNFTSSGYTKHIVGYSADYNQENPNDHYYLIASPLAENITPSTITGMTEGTYDLYYFDQNGDAEQKEWINCKDVEGFAMENGVGYLYAHDEDIDLTFTGAAYEGDGKVDLVYEAAASYWNGWNLVGNPFAEEAYANRDYYALQNGKELSLVTNNAAVGAMEGIFVLAAENETEMTFTTEPAGSKGSMVSLNVSRANRVLDRTVVRFGGDRVLPKFQLRATSTKLYIPMEGKDYAVVSAEGMGEMPVNFRAEKSGSYTISAKGEEVNFTYLHLIDNMTGADVDLLATPSYSFDASTTDYESRFRLLFATGSSEEGDTFGFVNGAGNLSIYGIEGEATLQVMDVNGRVLSTETFSGSYEKSLNVAAGIYMLRLTNGDNVKVQKMVVK